VIALSHKSKHYGLIAVKLLLLCLTISYLADRLWEVKSAQWSDLFYFFGSGSAEVLGSVFLISVFSLLMDVGKWKLLANTLEDVSWSTALKQHLCALSLGLATPAKLGEYGIKSLYFEPKLRKRAALLNLWSNGSQLAITLVFGLGGVLILFSTLTQLVNTTSLLLVMATTFILLGLLLVWFFRQRMLSKYNPWFVLCHNAWIPKRVRFQVVGLSVARYLCFSLQFVWLLKLLGAENEWTVLWSFSWVMYLFSSALPSGLLLDLAIRGAVSVALFSLLGIAEGSIVAAVLVAWLLNTFLPASFGAPLALLPQSNKP
jgi:uncharacterized membrane protein YbhN (UPF0104 family)